MRQDERRVKTTLPPYLPRPRSSGAILEGKTTHPLEMGERSEGRAGANKSPRAYGGVPSGTVKQRTDLKRSRFQARTEMALAGNRLNRPV